MKLYKIKEEFKDPFSFVRVLAYSKGKWYRVDFFKINKCFSPDMEQFEYMGEV